MVSKDENGNFRSFGVRYEGDIIWTNDENWYNAWIKGEVVPKSITLQQVQRRTYQINDAGERVMINGRPVLEIVTQEMVDRDPVRYPTTMVWEITTLKTKSQLQGEDEMEIWEKGRVFEKKERLLTIAEKYNATAKKAAETAVISKEQEAQLDSMLKMFEQ